MKPDQDPRMAQTSAPGGQRSRGRPRMTWRSMTVKECEELGHGVLWQLWLRIGKEGGTLFLALFPIPGKQG